MNWTDLAPRPLRAELATWVTKTHSTLDSVWELKDTDEEDNQQENQEQDYGLVKSQNKVAEHGTVLYVM